MKVELMKKASKGVYVGVTKDRTRDRAREDFARNLLTLMNKEVNDSLLKHSCLIGEKSCSSLDDDFDRIYNRIKNI